MSHRLEQEIQFCTAPDGIRIAYATVGDRSKFPLVRVGTWLTHLEFDWRSPIWQHWLEVLAKDFFLVRYDPRGCGLSDWEVEDVSFDAWVRDLETVTNAIGLDRFALLGLSQGGAVAIEYSLLHPGRVSQLILCGAYARGWTKRGQSAVEERTALMTLTKQGWGRDNPAYRQIFTTLFVPEASAEQMRWFNDLQRKSMSPENAVRFQIEAGKIDIVDELAKVSVPTLVVHARNDSVAPYEEGRILAASIPKARFVTLEGRNHILLEKEPAWERFLHEIRTFTGVSEARGQRTSQLTYPSSKPTSQGKNKDRRKLAAIMFTDMVGYTELTQKNETLALQLVEQLEHLLRPAFRKHRGREIKTMGDGFLVEFASALEATQCAIDIQERLHERNMRASSERKVHLRIGIHLGDVEHKRGDVYGDAVNIASRIEPLARSDGICVSEQVFDQVRNKTKIRIAELGKQDLRNVRLPVLIYEIVMPWQKRAPNRKVKGDVGA